LSRPEQWLFRRAYGRPEVAIVLSEFSRVDGDRLGASETRVIPYGIPDESGRFAVRAVRHNEVPQVLFVGAVRESKGVIILLEALAILRTRDVPFSARVVGPFSSAEFEARARGLVNTAGLDEHVELSGTLIGDDKWRSYAGADVFCFPTFYESESFPVVLLEAMQFGLPVVATRWRGVPAIVREGETGYLVATRDAVAVADRLEQLLGDRDLRASMGVASRERYLAEYTLEVWRSRIERALLRAAN
jgi:glycosyltransferase involved in cell wall biosynthesis